MMIVYMLVDLNQKKTYAVREFEKLATEKKTGEATSLKWRLRLRQRDGYERFDFDEDRPRGQHIDIGMAAVFHRFTINLVFNNKKNKINMTGEGGVDCIFIFKFLSFRHFLGSQEKARERGMKFSFCFVFFDKRTKYTIDR